MSRSKRKPLRELPFTNDAGQILKPGDKCVFVPVTRGRAVIGTYRGLVGDGARMTYPGTKTVSRHRVTGKPWSEKKVLAELGEEKIRYSWRDSKSYAKFAEQSQRLRDFRKAHYHYVEEPATLGRYSGRRRLYKIEG